MSSSSHHFLKQRPVFGLDVGPGSVTIMQTTARHGQRPRILSYGSTSFDAAAMHNGVIIVPEQIAKATLELYKYQLTGTVSTKRVSVGIPASYGYSELLSLPKQSSTRLKQTVERAGGRRFPLPLSQLYLDYKMIRPAKGDGQTLKQSNKMLNVCVTAIPRPVIDSRLQLVRLLGLEPVAIETNLAAAAKLFSYDIHSDLPAVVVDFGALSTDIAIFDHQLITSATVGGSDDLTIRIRNALRVSQSEAQIIKTRYGLGASKRQAEILAALQPPLHTLLQTIRRLIRHYGECYGHTRSIGQVIIVGSGLVPGMSDYLTDNLRLAVRSSDPWEYCTSTDLGIPIAADKSRYEAALGLSLLPARNWFKQ